MLPGVTVSVKGTNIAGVQTTVTGEAGTYRLLNLPPGTYDVTFELSGFRSHVLQGVRISLGSVLEQNVGLALTQLTESVRRGGGDADRRHDVE